MDDKEESEFHKVWDKLCDDGYRTAYEAARHCWVEAKRSQPAITVPAYDMHHSAPVRNLMAKMDSAGIKYTIGE